MAIVYVGIDLAKNVFAVHGVDEAGKPALVRRQAARTLDDLPAWARQVIGDLLEELRHLDERIVQYDRHLAHIARDDPSTRQLMQLSCVGPTTATAIVAMVGRANEFKSAPASSQHGSGSFPGNTAPVASLDSAASPRPAITTCVRS